MLHKTTGERDIRGSQVTKELGGVGEGNRLNEFDEFERRIVVLFFILLYNLD